MTYIFEFQHCFKWFHFILTHETKANRAILQFRSYNNIQLLITDFGIKLIFLLLRMCSLVLNFKLPQYIKHSEMFQIKMQVEQ
jgi:hypothetical protein